tara:strand:+ start:1479 stop:1595 length:117 start_codon:yes stop_codon:yes gene_type:complete
MRQKEIFSTLESILSSYWITHNMSTAISKYPQGKTAMT